MIFYLCVFWLFWIHFPFFAALPFQVENSPPRKERGGSLRGPRLPLLKGSRDPGWTTQMVSTGI